MEIKDVTLVSFYQLLGRIFYATAQADKVIRPEEVSELKQIIKNVWLDADNVIDQFNSDAAFQIEIVFDYLLDNEIIVEGIINQVKSFKSIHKSLFTKNTIELIMKTALGITSSFAKNNKSEVVFLSQLRLALEK